LLYFDNDAKKLSVRLSRHWNFEAEAKAIGLKAKAIKIWPRGASRLRPGLEVVCNAEFDCMDTYVLVY